MLILWKRDFSKAVNSSLQNVQFLAQSMWVRRAGVGKLRFEWLLTLRSREQLREGNAESIRNSDDRGQAEVLSSGLQVSDKGPMHFAIICKRFLRCETASDADFADALSESFQDVVHAQSVCEWLSDRLPLVH